MKKKILCLALSFITIICLAGCNSDTTQYNNESAADDSGFQLPDNIVAIVNGREITYDRYAMTLATYKSYYDEMGFNIGDDESDFSSFQERTLNSLIENEVLISTALNKGYDKLNSQEEADLNDKLEKEISSLGDIYEDQVQSDLEKDPSLDKDELIKNYIASESYYYTGTEMTYDEYIDFITSYTKEQYYLERLKNDTLSDISIDESDIKEFYKTSLESDKEKYTSNPELYGAAFDSNNSIPPLFAPKGYSRIYALYFNADMAVNNQEYQNNLTRLNEICLEYGEISLKSTYDSNTDTSNLNSLEREYQQLISDNAEIRNTLASIPISNANDSLLLLEKGCSFEEVMENYGQNAIPRAISLLYQADVDWDDTVKKAFSELNPGEYSDVIETKSGYYIIYYLDDIPSGEYGYNDAHDIISNALLANKQSEVWNKKTEEWVNEADIKINETLLYSAGKE